VRQLFVAIFSSPPVRWLLFGGRALKSHMMLEVSRRRRCLTFVAPEHPSRFLPLQLLLLAAAAYTELNLTVINLDFITARCCNTVHPRVV
jgi:hypothetical protein